MPSNPAITSYEQALAILDAQMEADSCLPEGSLALARKHGSHLLTAPRLDLEQMAPHRRWWTGSHFEMRLAHYRGITVLCAKHSRVLAELEQLLGGDAGSWVGDYSKLREINDYLSPFALQNTGTALFFTPAPSMFEQREREDELPTGYEARWLSSTEIEQMRGIPGFSNALGFSKDRPDVQVLAAYHEGKPVAVAGASADSKIMRQIGIDVLADHRRHGLATALVRKLSRAVLNAGFVPFYGTSPSHIISQLLALKAGFEPSWYEFVSSSLLDIEVD